MFADSSPVICQDIAGGFLSALTKNFKNRHLLAERGEGRLRIGSLTSFIIFSANLP